MRLAIIGSRTFNNYALLSKTLGVHFYYMIHSDEFGEYEIISGGANGTDNIAKQYAENTNIKYVEFPAEWNKYGKSAGFIRNQQIIDNSDMVLAFWNGESRGTADTIEKAKRAKKPTFIIYF